MSKEKLENEELDDNEILDDEIEEDEIEEENDDEKGDNQKKTGAAEKGGKKSKSFTQEQVSKMMAKEKKQGKASVYNELGIDPNNKDQMKLLQTILKGATNIENEEDSGKNEEYEKAINEANTKALKAEIKAQAVGLGVRRDSVEDVATLIMAKKENNPDEEMSEENIASLIGEYKTKYPGFFGDANEEEEDKRKKGTGSSVGTKGSKGKGRKGPQTMAERLLAGRTTEKKDSFWK